MTQHRYHVWDALNERAEDARELMASTPERAAELYAEDDTDGQLDGIYTRDGHALSVRRADLQEVYECVVRIDHITTFEVRSRRRIG